MTQATTTDAVMTVLPAKVDRWRPTRAGLVSLWRYWDETFTFHGGRLLLRGPNGSGKSMALELLLPFLLDADASPHRLTSGAKERGGLFDRVMTGSADPSRTGFAWVEFRRDDETFTVGTRIRASHSTRKVDLDFFTTSLAVGRDLHLLDAARTPLSKKSLAEAIGDTGRVHASRDEHRAAVRETLFPGFSADRYASVITALLALRKEKLSQHLDLAKLSETLSESLPPIDEHDIASVAEGFERLDRRRAELDALEREVVEVRQLAARQRDYARAVVVGMAGEARGAESRRDAVTRAEREARSDLEQVEQESAEAAKESRLIEARSTSLGIERDALKDSDAYREGASLDDLRAHARRLRSAADRAVAMAQLHEQARADAAGDLEATTDRRATAIANLAPAVRELEEAAAHLGAEAVVGEAEAVPEPDRAERLVLAWVETDRGRVGEVRTAVGAHARAVDARTHAERQVAGDEEVVDLRLTHRRGAAADEADAVAAYLTGVEEWAASCATLGPTRVAEALPHPPDEPGAVTDFLGRLTAAVWAEEAVARRNLATACEAAAGERSDLLEERARWAHSGLVKPDPPAWRSTRTGRPGAPLWQLVDLAPGVDPAVVDGLEAALTGAGLLDAWVTPGGGVEVDGAPVDLVLGARPVDGMTLAGLLVAASTGADGDPPVGDQVVAGVLASVSVGTTAVPDPAGPDVLVATDGTYRLGTAVGRGPRRPALLLGALARERHRLERLAAVDAALAAVDALLGALHRDEDGLDRRRAAVEAELAAVPSGAPVETARRATADAAARLDEAEGRLRRSRALLVEAEDSVRQALRALTAIAVSHGLPTSPDDLDQVAAALRRLEHIARSWSRRRRELVRADLDHARDQGRCSTAEKVAAEAAAAEQEAQREVIAVEGRLTTLESAVGVEYRALLDRLSAIQQERSVAEDRQRELAAQLPALERRVGTLTSHLAAAEAARQAAEDDRAQAHSRFVDALGALGGDAGIDLSGPLDNATAVLAAARTVASAHERIDVDEQAVERLSERVRERVHQAQAALGARVDLTRELADAGWWVLRTLVGGIRRGTAELANALGTELAEGRAELVADEERLFERTLAGSVRRALADRIRTANRLVDGINDQLDAVRTMAGEVQVRLRWEVEPDQLEAVRAARSLLLRDPADLSDDERASLQAFVRARVDQARAELELSAPWEARLRETLDYRAWHRFSLLIAHRDWEGFQPATARRLQKLSTGERSIALHLPMIASVAAHYADEEGHPAGCPRLILLDELFAGVDAANRAQLFGTFSAWQLDAVFTSDHEWCQYATLDGIAIHHLHPPRGDEPVTSSRFTWDGHRRSADPPAA